MALLRLVGGAAALAGCAMAHPKFGFGGRQCIWSTNNWPAYSLILRKINEIGATWCQILRLKCIMPIHFSLHTCKKEASDATI